MGLVKSERFRTPCFACCYDVQQAFTDVATVEPDFFKADCMQLQITTSRRKMASGTPLPGTAAADNGAGEVHGDCCADS